MLTVEQAFDISITEEGQFLMNEDFITETLGFTWDKIHSVFVKSAKEFSRRRPIFETKVMRGSSESGKYIMPEGTIAVNAIRYDILENYPRFMFPDFGQIQYEFEKHSRILRTFPPMQTLRVTYSREYTFSDSAPIIKAEYTVDYETEVNMLLDTHPKKGTLKVSKNGLEMKESGVTWQEVDNGTPEHEKIKMITLTGTLGKGLYNPETRELALFLKKKTGDGDIEVWCTPKYSYINELSLADTLFVDLFKSYLLEAIASLRNQATQAHLHNIDLSSDDLYGRARALRARVIQNLRETFDFGATALI